MFLTITVFMKAQTQGKPCTSANLVVNGNFSAGYAGFTSQLPLNCSCTGAGNSYCVNTNFNLKCTGWPNVPDHTPGTATPKNFLIVDGLEGTPTPANRFVWREVVNVCATKTYTFSFWANSVYTDPFNLDMFISGTGMGSTNAVTANIPQIWTRFQSVWTAPATGTVGIEIRQNSFDAERDFGIDDVSFIYCCPPFSVSSNTTICAGSSAAIGATGATSYTWYPGGITGSTITVSPAVTTNYTVNAAGGCFCGITTSVITVTVLPAVTLTPDFVLSGTTIMGNPTDYRISAVPNALTSWPSSNFWWEISEVDVATGTIPVLGKTMTNAQTWWYAPFITNNTFPGYNHNTTSASWPISTPMSPYPSPYTGSGYSTNPPPGTFGLGKRYRITRATFGDCLPWTTISKSIYICSGCKGNNGPTFIVEDDTYSPAMPKELMIATNIQSVKSIDKDVIVISPNPNSGIFNLTSASETIKDIYIYDIAGKLIYENKGVLSKNLNISLNEQPKGIYIVRVTDGQTSITQKIIKE